jgi:hypothetical protein
VQVRRAAVQVRRIVEHPVEYRDRAVGAERRMPGGRVDG